MFIFLLSTDCGISYSEIARAELISELSELCQEWDEKGMRWVIEDEEGVQFAHCQIHTEIWTFLMSELESET